MILHTISQPGRMWRRRNSRSQRSRVQAKMDSKSRRKRFVRNCCETETPVSSSGKLDEHKKSQCETLRRALIKADSVRSLQSRLTDETLHSSSLNLSQFFLEQDTGLTCSDSLSVIQSWDYLKDRVPTLPIILGDQIILKLIQLDGATVSTMNIGSSAKLVQKSKKLSTFVEDVVALLGPDLDELDTEIPDLRYRLSNLGFDDNLLKNLGEAISEAISTTLLRTCSRRKSTGVLFSDDTKKSWALVFDYVATSSKQV